MSYKIEILNERSFEIKEGQTILQASLEAGISHYHACGGNAKCSTCRVIVCEGGEYLSPQNELEKKLREKKNFPSDVRLACQAKVIGGDVKLQRIIKDDADLDLYVYGDSCDARQGIGEEKELALMFLDIRNFTPFIEQHLPFDVIHLIRRLNVLFNEVIESNNGKIVEFRGDGFYAVFGLDENVSTSVSKAVNAGNELISKVKKLNDNYINKFFDVNIEVGIGLHAGKVIVGEKGVGELRSLTAMGFAVNVAARLESVTKELNNNFIVSENVYTMLDGNIKPAEQKLIQLKGVSKPFCVRLMGKSFSYKEF